MRHRLHKRTNFTYDPATRMLAFAVSPYEGYPQEALDWHRVHLGQLLCGLGISLEEVVMAQIAYNADPDGCDEAASIGATEPEADDFATVELAAGKPYPLVVVGSLN